MVKSRVASTIAAFGLLRLDAPVVVALSGGADSVALLSILVSLGYDCIPLHCNFHLRAQESDRDERHARNIAAQHGCDIRVKHFDVTSYMKHHGVSLEMACRELRYRWFREVMRETGAQAIAVGHHLDDNIETFFIKLMRRAGISGIAAMRYRRNDVVRPLLHLRRSEIESYLGEVGLEYVTDHTNLESDFERNRLRNKVIPVLAREFPASIPAIADTIDHIRQASDFIDSQMQRLRNEYISESNTIAVSRIINDYPESASFILFNLLADSGVNMAMARDIVASAGRSGLRFGSRLLNRGELIPMDSDEPIDVEVTLAPPWFEVSEHDISDFHPERFSNTTIYLDSRVLDGNPIFRVRSWRDGDVLEPFGMRGKKKLSDIFSDAKLSVADKRRVQVLTRNDVILWVIGIRASRHFAVSESTRSYLKIDIGKSPV